MNGNPTWHRITLNALQRRLTGPRSWTWQTRLDRGRKRLGLVGPTGRFYWFRLNAQGAALQLADTHAKQDH